VKLRGNAQMLPNTGVLAGWSGRDYSSEFSPDSRCVLEAVLAGDRFSSYRAYKFDFVGTPAEPPALTTHACGSGYLLTSNVSVFLSAGMGQLRCLPGPFMARTTFQTPFQELGRISRSGFETTYIFQRFWALSHGQANAANGTSLGCAIKETILPNGKAQNITLAGLSVDRQHHRRRHTRPL